MALDKEKIRNLYPIPAYNYRVRIGETTYGFSQVNGLQIQYDTITYRHGLSYVEGPHYLPGLLQPIQISLQKGVVGAGSPLLEWINTIEMDKVKKQDITIDLCDEKGQPVVSWQVIDAFPTALSAPTFDAEAQQIAIESLDLMATGLHINYHSSGQVGGTR